jgi:hypothetical protein
MDALLPVFGPRFAVGDDAGGGGGGGGGGGMDSLLEGINAAEITADEEETLAGSEGEDTLAGEGAEDTLTAGEDTTLAGEGEDTLAGAEGGEGGESDTTAGAAGADTLAGGAGAVAPVVEPVVVDPTDYLAQRTAAQAKHAAAQSELAAVHAEYEKLEDDDIPSAGLRKRELAAERNETRPCLAGGYWIELQPEVVTK